MEVDKTGQVARDLFGIPAVNTWLERSFSQLAGLWMSAPNWDGDSVEGLLFLNELVEV